MILDKIQKIRDAIRSRTTAYTQVFDRNNKYTDVVLKDLAKFCRANETTFKEDARLHAVLEGRREVYLRICHHLKLTADELIELFGRPPNEKG